MAEASQDDARLNIKREILEDLREKLVRDLQPENFFSFLRSKRVLDEDDCDEIVIKGTRKKKAEAFLDLLGKKGHLGFDYFCEAFVVAQKTQPHLFNQLLDAFEDKIYDNQVELLPVPQYEYEFVNMQMLNHNLPRPGEAGAPCLPSAATLVHCQDNLFELTNGLPVQAIVFDNAANFGTTSPPPAYSER